MEEFEVDLTPMHYDAPPPSGPTAEDFLIAKSRTVTMVGEIDEWVARKVMFSLHSLADATGNPITLIINSGGGEVFEAHGMYDTIMSLRREGAVINGRVHGYAMSAAILPLMACTTRTMTNSGVLMIHGLREIRAGDVRNMEADQDCMNKTVEIQARMLAERTHRDHAFWKELLRDQLPRYYIGAEALEAGLVDSIE